MSRVLAGQKITAAMFNRGIVAAPVASTANGTATAANTTEVRDSVLGNYTFTAEAGRWYQVVYVGSLTNVDTVSVRMNTRIRDGVASTPTTASTMLAESTDYVTETGSTGRASIVIESQPVQLSAGTHTLSVFTQSPDSAICTPVPSSLPRTLYVRDLGPV